jgi:subtilisin family serine protease
MKRVAPDPDFVKLTFPSYELQIPVSSQTELENAQLVIRKIYAENNANVKAGLLRAGEKSVVSPFYSVTSASDPSWQLVDPMQFWTESISKYEQNAGAEGDLGKLINLMERSASSCEDLCPEVVLIDKPIFPHPDVRAGVRGLGGGPPDPVSNSKQSFVHADFKKDVDHGTHLAGIIAARRNGFGLVGIDPDASITSLIWNDYIDTRVDDLAKFVYKHNEESMMYIYVTASSWAYPSLPSADERFDNTLAAIIRDSKPFWITAAGNEGGPVRPTTLNAPMNLGDLSSVLVIAACSPCGADARLLQESNFADPASPASEKIVHVAAPGKSVPSTVTDGRYAESDGTSQAAAFVGGLASLMVRTWPKLYHHPGKLRMRILTTSRPVESKEFGSGVAAGVVDAANAVRDPRINWIAFKSTGTMEEAVDLKWTADKLDTKVAGNFQKKTYNTEDIVSMYRFDDGLWTLYLKTHPGPVDVFDRVGPVSILTSGDVLSVTKEGAKKTYALSAVQQLIRAEMGPLKQ